MRVIKRLLMLTAALRGQGHRHWIAILIELRSIDDEKGKIEGKIV